MIITHQKIWQFLTRSAQLEKLSHAYLFFGPKNSGKKKLAFEFVKWLFKDYKPAATAEFYDIEKKQHPDFVFITPEKKEIKISQVREVIWRLALKPSVAPFKIAIFDQAHCFNQEAQNCLLKTLEEPKGSSILFLITEYPEALFPTIRSRCQIIKFPPIKKEEFNSQKLKIQEKIISDLRAISKSDLASRFQYVKNLTKEESQDLKEILETWQKYFREILISEINQEQSQAEPKHSFSPPVERFSFGYEVNKLIKILKMIQNTNFLISTTNVNPKLALEILMLEL